MIAVNGKIFTQRMSGLGRFAFEVIKRMILVNLELTIFTPNKPLHSDYQILSKYVVRDDSLFPPFLWEIFRLASLARPDKYTALWSPANIGPINPKISHYLTLHDLTFIHDRAWMNFTSRLIYKNLIPLICKRAIAVISDCNFIRHEIIGYMPYKRPEDIYMSYLGSDHVSLKKIAFNRFELPEQHFVFLGNIDRRKNLNNIIKAWSLACTKTDSSIKLFIVGEVKTREKYSLDLNHDSIQVLSKVSDDELFYLLSKSRGLIFPSFYEGFGFPILEAMRCGCPVITSNLGAMEEIAGQSALLVNPCSVENIAGAIIELSNSDSLHTELIEKGYKRQMEFTWDKTASYYINLLSRVSL